MVISGIESLEKRSRGSSTHELASCELQKALVPRSSCGCVRVKLAPSACSHRCGFQRTRGSDLLRVSTRNQRSRFGSRTLERSCVDLDPRVGGLRHLCG
jgi:hypothetical protein